MGDAAHRLDSLRGRRGAVPPTFDETRVGASEAQRFPVFEAAFFGNVFAIPPRAFVCVDDAPAVALEAQRRVWALPGPVAGLSRCAMQIVGRCGAAAFVQDGVDYRNEAIEDYLSAAR